MSFFKSLGKVAKAVVQVAAPVVLASVQPEALTNVAVCGLGKHLVQRLPNDAIPYLNLGVSVALQYAKDVPTLGWDGALVPALQKGAALAGLSTAIHQSIKLPTKSAIRLNGQTL